MTKKRGDANTLWIVIAAVLGLIVLAVLIFIFNKQISDFAVETKSCTLRGGKCSVACIPSYQQEIPNTDCVPTAASTVAHCCIDVQQSCTTRGGTCKKDCVNSEKPITAAGCTTGQSCCVVK